MKRPVQDSFSKFIVRYLGVLSLIILALLFFIILSGPAKKNPVPDPVIQQPESAYLQTPGFVFCVDGENAMVYEKSVGPIEISSDGYLTFEGEDDIIRIKDDNCVIRWRKK